MKITDILVRNYQRVTFADIHVAAPILFLAGANEAGKTSIADAVYHVITGEARRVALKKDFASLVHDGEKKGSAVVTTADRVPVGIDGDDAEPGSMTLSIPTDKRASNITPHALMPLLLDAHQFIAMPADARRQVILSLNPVKLSGKAILQKLLDKGADPAKAREIGAVLLTGFAGAHTEAKTKASEARGSWKTTTGEAYGSKKAPEWKAEKPTWSMERIDEHKAKVSALDDEIHDLTIRKGELGEQARAFNEQNTRRETLKSAIAGKARAQAKLDTDLDTLAEWEPKVAHARQEAGVQEAKPLTCPHCAGLVDVVDGKLAQHVPPGKEAAKYKALLPTYEQSLAQVQSFVAHDREVLERIARAEAALAELDKHPLTCPAKSEMDDVEAKLAEKRRQREADACTLRVEQEAQHKAEQADEITKRALGYHTDVEQWEAIADMLAPGGIPSELMANALKPLHERLAKTAATTGWEPVTLTGEMGIMIGSRPYSLASKSAQWRAQAALVEAMAHVSGAKTFMLDEVDILDAHNRLAFLKWMHSIAHEVDTAIIIGTFKQAPSCPATFQVVWVEGGLAPAGIVDAEVERKAA